MNREEAIATYTGPEKTDVCCANCNMLIPVNKERWCDLHDHPIIDPTRYRCNDFDLWDGEDYEDSLI